MGATAGRAAIGDENGAPTTGWPGAVSRCTTTTNNRAHLDTTTLDGSVGQASRLSIVAGILPAVQPVLDRRDACPTGSGRMPDLLSRTQGGPVQIRLRLESGFAFDD